MGGMEVQRLELAHPWPIENSLNTGVGVGGEARIVNEAFSNHVTTITLPAIGSASCVYEND